MPNLTVVELPSYATSLSRSGFQWRSQKGRVVCRDVVTPILPDFHLSCKHKRRSRVDIVEHAITLFLTWLIAGSAIIICGLSLMIWDLVSNLSVSKMGDIVILLCGIVITSIGIARGSYARIISINISTRTIGIHYCTWWRSLIRSRSARFAFEHADVLECNLQVSGFRYISIMQYRSLILIGGDQQCVLAAVSDPAGLDTLRTMLVECGLIVRSTSVEVIAPGFNLI